MCERCDYLASIGISVSAINAMVDVSRILWYMGYIALTAELIARFRTEDADDFKLVKPVLKTIYNDLSMLYIKHCPPYAEIEAFIQKVNVMFDGEAVNH
jgi:hypothetical protein